MRKIAVLVQILIVVVIVGYGTYNLFIGNFAAAFSTFPFLMAYYVFVIARQKRAGPNESEDNDDERP